MARKSPTARTLEHCRKLGWSVDVVERRVGPATKDLFGMIDIVAMTPSPGAIIGIQATSGNNVAARISKIQASPFLEDWINTGALLEVWGWRKLKEQAGERWRLRAVRVTAPDHCEEVER